MKGLLSLSFLLLLVMQLGLGLGLFYFRYLGGETFIQLHEFSLKEESLMLSGHIVSYFLLIFVPAHLIFFYSPTRRDLKLSLFACFLAFLVPLLGFVGTWLELGIELILIKAFGFLIFSAVWMLLSLKAFQKAMQVYYLRLNLQKY